jgi:hypothetical protein
MKPTHYLIILKVILNKYYIAEGKYFDIFIVYYVLILHMNINIMGTFTLIAVIAMILFYILYLSAMAMAIKIARYECYIFFIFSLNYF